MAEEPQKKGLSLFTKAIIGVGLLILIFGILSTVKNAVDFLFTIVKIGIGVAILFLVVKGIMSYFVPKAFSPTEDFKDKIIKAGKMRKPFNIKRLFLRGEDMLVYSKWFNIEGILFLPYISAKVLTGDDGKAKYQVKINHNTGQPIIDEETGKPIMEEQHEILKEKDGEWCFIGSTGWFIFRTPQIVRAHYSLCSAMGENVFIKSPNLVPIGDYLYPCQQWQDDIMHVLAQHKSEALVQSYENFLDLVSNVAQMALGADPTFNKIMKAQAEQLGQRGQGILNE